MEERMKKLKAAKTRMLVERWVWFVIGVFVNSFGIALITKAALGTSPISSLPYVLSLEFPLTLGMFTFIINMLFIVIQALLLKDEFKLFQWLQILVNVAFSAFIDVGMALLSWLAPTSIVEQIVALLLGCIVLGVGVSIEVAPNVLLVPGEGAVRAISLFTHKRFGSCKVAFDSTLAAIALVLSLVFFGYLNGIGVGTLITALCVGNVVNFCNKRVPLTGHIVNLRIKCERIDSILKKAAAQKGSGCAVRASDSEFANAAEH